MDFKHGMKSHTYMIKYARTLKLLEKNTHLITLAIASVQNTELYFDNIKIINYELNKPL